MQSKQQQETYNIYDKLLSVYRNCLFSKTCSFPGRYLINKYLGTFLDETISLDQVHHITWITLHSEHLKLR